MPCLNGKIAINFGKHYFCEHCSPPSRSILRNKLNGGAQDEFVCLYVINPDRDGAQYNVFSLADSTSNTVKTQMHIWSISNDYYKQTGFFLYFLLVWSFYIFIPPPLMLCVWWYMTRVTRKQSLRSLSLSYQKNDGRAWPRPSFFFVWHRLFKNKIYDVSRDWLREWREMQSVRVKFLKVGVIPKQGWAWPRAPILLLVWQRQRP